MGAVTLVTGVVKLVTRSYMLRMVERFLDRALSECFGDRAVEMCGLSVFILWLPHVVRSGQAPGQGTVGAH